MTEKVFVSYCHESASWSERVLRFCDLLRENGVDATIDQYDDVLGRDWSLWGPQEIEDAAFVLCVASRGFRVRWEQSSGTGVADEGRAIRQKFSQSREAVRFVLLEDSSRDDIPPDYRGWGYISVPSLDSGGLEEVIALCTNQSLLPKPPLGEKPELEGKRRLRLISGESAAPNKVRARNKLGVVAALTGPNESLGKNMADGALLAVRQWNRQYPSRPIEFAMFDSLGNPDRALSIAKQLADDEALLAIVGPGFSDETFAAMPTFERALIPCVSPGAARSSLSLEGWSMFNRVIANDAALAPSLVKVLAKFDSIIIIDDGTSYGRGLASAVRSARYMSNDASFPLVDVLADAELLLKASGSRSAFFFGGYYTEAALLLDLIRRRGMVGTFVAADGCLDQQLITNAGVAAEGALLVGGGSPSKGNEFDSSFVALSHFVGSFRNEFGTLPGLYAAEAFDAATLIADGFALEKQGRELGKFLRGHRSARTTRPIELDSNGELKDPLVYLHRVDRGEFVCEQIISLA